MALSPGTIVVANPSLEDPGGPRGLFAVDPATGQQTTLAQGDLLVEPWNVSFLADGRLLVADRSAFGGTGGLIVVDPTSGQQIKVSSSPVFTRPFGMVLIGHGQLVVAYTEHAGGLGALAHVNPANGDHQRLAEDFRFDTPFAMALDAAGNIFVTDPSAFIGSDNRLIRIDTSNRLSIRDDTPGIYTGVAVEPTGNLIVTSDAGFTGGQQVLRFDPTSGPPTVLAQGGMIRAPFGVAIEASGVILVVDLPGAVIRINPATGAQTTVSTGGSLPGARGVAVAR